jgi:hypothetical protein
MLTRSAGRLRSSPARWSVALLLLAASASALAGKLAEGALVAPLAPGQESRLRIPITGAVDPAQPVWVSYQLVALSRDTDPQGDVVIEGSFEGVATPMNAMLARFDAGDMQASVSAGTVPEQLERIAGKRDPEELRALMGDSLFAAYEAVNAGQGRILTGRLLREIPPPTGDEGLLLVSVERAAGIQPVGLLVVAGQGELPVELQSRRADSILYTVGRVAGVLVFLALLYRFLSGRRRR